MIHYKGVLPFPVNENVPCKLGTVGTKYTSVKNVELFYIRHLTRLFSPVKGKDVTVVLDQVIIVPRDEAVYDRVSLRILKHITFIYKTLGGAQIIQYNHSFDKKGEWFIYLKKLMSELISTEYYLKTRIVPHLNKKKITFVDIGEMPYIALSPTLQYFYGEDKHNYKTFKPKR